jgi:putative membrane protein
MGLFLIGLGTLAMVMGTLEYWTTLKDLRQQAPLSIWRPSFIMALIMSVTGLVLFLSIFSRVL